MESWRERPGTWKCSSQLGNAGNHFKLWIHPAYPVNSHARGTANQFSADPGEYVFLERNERVYGH